MHTTPAEQISLGWPYLSLAQDIVRGAQRPRELPECCSDPLKVRTVMFPATDGENAALKSTKPSWEWQKPERSRPVGTHSQGRLRFLHLHFVLIHIQAKWIIKSCKWLNQATPNEKNTPGTASWPSGWPRSSLLAPLVLCRLVGRASSSPTEPGLLLGWLPCSTGHAHPPVVALSSWQTSEPWELSDFSPDRTSTGTAPAAQHTQESTDWEASSWWVQPAVTVGTGDASLYTCTDPQHSSASHGQKRGCQPNSNIL